MKSNSISLLIFTCQNREHLLAQTIKSFLAKCNFNFHKIILAVDGQINVEIINQIVPDTIVQQFNRSGYVNNIANALKIIDTSYFFWLEDDWEFNTPINLNELETELTANKDWVQVILHKDGPLNFEQKAKLLKQHYYQNVSGFSANPCICNTQHLQSAFLALQSDTKGDQLGVDGFENYLTRTFEKENKKCVVLDPVNHTPISHSGYLESTARNWHMTNSLETKTKIHLLVIPAPSIFRRLLMAVKLIYTFILLIINQFYNNKVYEYCFRIITSAKQIKKDN